MLLTALIRMYLTRSLKPFVFGGTYENKLDFADLDDLGLYVHIPFCRSLCGFCPYCKVNYDAAIASQYKAALLKEIDLVCRGRKEKKQAGSLYFGGGTPALMIDDLPEIIQKLKQYFTINGGVGVELHPDDISAENLEKLKRAGVTMVSIGIQSFHDACLQKLGRSGKDFKDKLKLARSFQFEAVDVDLIFAIPGQTDEILAGDVQTAFECGATQLSTYPFIDFTFADNSYKPLPEKEKKRMLGTLTALSAKIGLNRTSVWTFAKKGTKTYSSVTRDTFLGFGVSAATLLKETFKINTFSISDYINRIDAECLPTSLTLSFTKRQRAGYFLFWSAYSLSIDPDRFEDIIGVPLKKLYGIELWIAEKLGLVKRSEGKYVLTDKAAYLYHYIEQAYTTAYIDKMWNVSRNVGFPDQIVLK